MQKITRLAKTGASVALAFVAMNAGSAVAETQVPLATWGGASHVNVRHFVPALEQAIEETKPNNLVLQHYPGGQLAEDRDMPMAVPTGQVKLGWITVNGWTGTVPDTRIMDAPTGLTMAELDDLIDQPDGLMSVLQKKFEDKNSLLVGLADLGPPAIISSEPIMSPDDFKGKKVRVFSEGQAETIRSFGGSPVTLAFSEIYSAMQFGTVDAVILGFQGVNSQRMHEVSKHLLVPASFFGTTMMGWAANKPWVEGMPEQDRAAFLEAMDIASHSNREAIVEEIDQLADTYRERGMTVTFLSSEHPEYGAWQSQTAPILEKTLSRLSPDVAALFQNKE